MATCKDCFHWCVCRGDAPYYSEGAECCSSWVNKDSIVETVHGRWEHPKGHVVSNGFICSNCGHEEASHHPINPRSCGCCIADENGNFFYPPKINYCPNCGATMDGDGNA